MWKKYVLILTGHAIECGWFLLEVAQKREDRQLAQRAISEFILSPLEYGWDSEYGGLFYKLDADQKPMADTEWNMKLWWPHCEAMIATLMSYEYTRDTQLLETFDTVFGYVCKYVSWRITFSNWKNFPHLSRTTYLPTALHYV